MSKFAIVVMLPEPDDDKTRVDFIHREFDELDQITECMKEVELKAPNWRLITFCHVEDLPLLMENPL